MRSKLRAECMRFIRFSYFIDFLAMNALKKVYDDSLEEFQEQLRIKSEESEVFVQKEDVREIRSTIEPVFEVDLELDLVDMEPVREDRVEPYMPPPTGTSTIMDFRIIAHLNLKIPKEKKASIPGMDEQEEEYDEVSIYSIPQPEELAPAWLHIKPNAESHYTEIVNSLNEGLEVLQCYERWSKHPDMKLYIDVLE